MPDDAKQPGVIGRNLARITAELKLNPTEIARRTGVSRTTQWQLINGDVEEGSVQVAKRLAAGLDVPLDEFFREEVGELDVGPAIDHLEQSADLRGSLRPSITDEELAWLRGLPPIFWGRLPPATPAGLVALVDMRRLGEEPDGT